MKGQKTFHVNINQKRAVVAIFIMDKTDFNLKKKKKEIIKNRDHLHVYQDYIAMVNVYAT